MNASIQTLISLCFEKNDINRRRRRFYYCMSYESTRPNPLTKQEAKVGYEKAKRDMKSMTKNMSKLRRSLSATLIWGAGGQINVVKVNDLHINKNQFKSYFMMEKFEVDVFGQRNAG